MIDEKFAKEVIERQNKSQTLEQVALALRNRYAGLDSSAQNAFADMALRMFANYENKWNGEIDRTGSWIESDMGDADVAISVPLLTANADQAMTSYTKMRPIYIAKPHRPNHLNEQLAKMCQEVASAEFSMMTKNIHFQREFQYMALATVSYRQIVMDYRKDSPVVNVKSLKAMNVERTDLVCPHCGHNESMDLPMPDSPDVAPGETEPVQKLASPMEYAESDMTCPHCLSEGIQVKREPLSVDTEVTTPTKLKRPKLRIPNPISVQPDFSVMDFEDSRFIIRRQRIPKSVAEFYYGMSFESPGTDHRISTQIDSRQREPIRHSAPNDLFTELTNYVGQQGETVQEIEMWLEPCEYGLLFADGGLLGEKYPTGLYLHIVGDKLVTHRPCDRTKEWIRLIYGVRPTSPTGTGLVHLAELNEVINNCLSLEYAILRTHGFPFRILRGRYLKGLPQALQTIIANNIPDTIGLHELVHTEQPTGANGMLGVLSSKMEGYMQYVAGTMSPLGSGAADIRDLMGTATGATALQTMMTDRQGLAIQMRIDADIETLWAILHWFQQDKNNREYLLEFYDEHIVDAFYAKDLRSIFRFEPVKGTDEPQVESVNTFKVQSFAQLTANLTGLRQFDKATFYDIIAEIGKTLNIPIEIGSGRKERHLADNKIIRIKELYKAEMANDPAMAQIDPAKAGMLLFQAVTTKDQQLIQSIVGSRLPIQPGINDAQMMMEMQMTATRIETYMYDHEALMEAYSDWLQSDEGQNCAIPIQVAVGLLYAYSQDLVEQRKKMELSEQLAAMGIGVPGADLEDDEDEDEDEPEKKKETVSTKRKRSPRPKAQEKKQPKRDGTFGPGRPRDVKVETQYSE